MDVVRRYYHATQRAFADYWEAARSTRAAIRSTTPRTACSEALSTQNRGYLASPPR